MVTKFACVVLFALSALPAAAPASAPQSEIPPDVQATLLSGALRTASAESDPHPYDIEAVATTRIRSVHLESGSSEPSCESSPTCADAPVYVVAMRGHFACNTCSPPHGGRVGPGNEIMLVFEGAALHPNTFEFGDSYPDLQALGVPVRLGPPGLSPATLLAIARGGAVSGGEAHPRDIEMASGSLEAAAHVFNPTAMFHPSSPEEASETVYLVAIHGRFHAGRAPAGARRSKRSGSRVLELMINEAGEVTARAYRNTVAAPLRNLGAVTRLG